MYRCLQQFLAILGISNQGINSFSSTDYSLAEFAWKLRDKAKPIPK